MNATHTRNKISANPFENKRPQWIWLPIWFGFFLLLLWRTHYSFFLHLISGAPRLRNWIAPMQTVLSHPYSSITVRRCPRRSLTVAAVQALQNNSLKEQFIKSHAHFYKPHSLAIQRPELNWWTTSHIGNTMNESQIMVNVGWTGGPARFVHSQLNLSASEIFSH